MTYANQGRTSHPAMRDSGVPWLGEVPEYWSIKKLRNLLRPITERNRPDLPLLSVVREKGLIRRDITRNDENRNFIPEDLSNYKVVVAGRFVINKMKAWQGSYGISQHDGIVSPAYFVFELRGVASGFFHPAIRSRAYIPFFAQASDGVRIGQWDLSQVRMKEIPFLVPPLSEQAAILRFLDHVERRIGRYIRAKQNLIKLLEEQRQAIIDRAVRRGVEPSVRLKPSGVEWLQEVPENWTLKRFKFVARVVSGQVDPRRPEQRDKILIAPNHIRSGAGTIMRYETAEEQGADSGKYLVRQGQVVYSKIRPNLRKAAIAEVDCLCSADMYPIEVRKNELRPGFLLLLMLSGPFTRYAVDCSMRVAMPKVNREALGDCWLWYPAIDEQEAVIQSVKQAFSPINQLVARTEDEIALVQEFRTRLITDLVTGKLDVLEAAVTLPDEIEEIGTFEDEIADEPERLDGDETEAVLDEIDA